MAATKTRASAERGAEISKDLREVIERERKEFEQQQHGTLRFYHVRGRVVRDLKAGVNPFDHRKKGDFGTNPVEVLAEQIGQDKHTLYRSCQFFEMFPTDKEMDGLIAQIEEHGSTVGFSHVKVVLAAPDSKSGDPHTRRRNLLISAVHHNWTVKELVQKVEVMREGEKESLDSRQPSRAQKFSRRLGHFNKSAGKLYESLAEELTAPVEQMLRTPPAEVTFDMKKQLGEALGNMEKLKDRLSADYEAAKKLLDVFESKEKSDEQPAEQAA